MFVYMLLQLNNKIKMCTQNYSVLFKSRQRESTGIYQNISRYNVLPHNYLAVEYSI